jgi:hypothetical protein
MKRANQTEDDGRAYRDDESKRPRVQGVVRSLTAAEEERYLLLQRLQQEQASANAFGRSAAENDRNRTLSNLAALASRNAALESAQHQFAAAMARQQQQQTEDARYLQQQQQQQQTRAAIMADILQRCQAGGSGAQLSLPHNPFASTMPGAGGFGRSLVDQVHYSGPYPSAPTGTFRHGMFDTQPHPMSNVSPSLRRSNFAPMQPNHHQLQAAALAAATSLNVDRLSTNATPGILPPNYSSLLGSTYAQRPDTATASLLGYETTSGGTRDPAYATNTAPQAERSFPLSHQEPRLPMPVSSKKGTTKVEASYDPGHVKELSLPSDKGNLSEYQCLLREQILFFSVSMSDIQCSAQGRNKPISLGQVGVLCRHCSKIPPGMRPCGAVYFPAKLSGIYQASQNMAINHFSKSCQSIPESIRSMLLKLKERKSTVLGGGKHFWANGAHVIGVVEHEGQLRFKDE